MVRSGAFGDVVERAESACAAMVRAEGGNRKEAGGAGAPSQRDGESNRRVVTQFEKRREYLVAGGIAGIVRDPFPGRTLLRADGPRCRARLATDTDVAAQPALHRRGSEFCRAIDQLDHDRTCVAEACEAADI